LFDDQLLTLTDRIGYGVALLLALSGLALMAWLIQAK
jgi:hypothetical protein